MDSFENLEVEEGFDEIGNIEQRVKVLKKRKKIRRCLKKCFCSGPLPYICFFLCLVSVTTVSVTLVIGILRTKMDKHGLSDPYEDYDSMHYYTSVTIDSSLNISYYGISTTPLEIEDFSSEIGHKDSEDRIHMTFPMDYYLYRCEEPCYCGTPLTISGRIEIIYPAISKGFAHAKTHDWFHEQCKLQYGSDCVPSPWLEFDSRRQTIDINPCRFLETEMYETEELICYGKCTESPHLDTHDLKSKSENYGCENLEVSGVMKLFQPVVIDEDWRRRRRSIGVKGSPSMIQFAANYLDPHCRENSVISDHNNNDKKVSLCVGFDEIIFDVPQNGTVYCQRRM